MGRRSTLTKKSLDPGDSCAVETDSLVRRQNCQGNRSVLITTDRCPKLHTYEQAEATPKWQKQGTLSSSCSLLSHLMLAILCLAGAPQSSLASPLQGTPAPYSPKI